MTAVFLQRIARAGFFKRHLLPLLRFRGSPHTLALAFGLGVAIGVIPGTGGFIAAGCAALLRLNLPVMVAGALVTNPFTAPFLYMVSYRLGKWLLGSWLPEPLPYRLLVGTITGNLLLALGLGLAGYGVVRFWVMARRRRSLRVCRARWEA